MAFESEEIENKDTVRKSVDKNSDDDGNDTEGTGNGEETSESKTEEENTVDPITKKVNEIDIKVTNEDNVEVRVKTGEGTSRGIEGEENQKKRHSSEPDTPNSEREKSVSPQKKSNVSPNKERKVGSRQSPRLKARANKLSPGNIEVRDKASNSESEEGSPKKGTKVGPEKGMSKKDVKIKQENVTGEGSSEKLSGEDKQENSQQDRNPILRSLLNKPPLVQNRELGDFYKSVNKADTTYNKMNFEGHNAEPSSILRTLLTMREFEETPLNLSVKMPIDLYYVPGSAPCRAVLLAMKALNVNANLKLVDLHHGEHLKPEYIKLNPQHTVPTLVDDGFSLWESRAIMTYLANKYGKGNPIYPEDPKARAMVDQRLYFDIGTLYQRFSDYFYPQVFGGAPADKEKRDKLEDALNLLDTFLENQKFVAGSNLTLADLSLIASVSSMEATDIDFKKYNNIKRWYETVKATAPGYQEANEKGLDAFKALVKNMMKK